MSGTPLRIDLVVVDIDGCLVAIEHAPYRVEKLVELANLNRQSRFDQDVPPLTILSGRPHPYVDALMQVLDIDVPAIFENGVGLAFREPYLAEYREEVEVGRGSLESLARELRGRDDLFIQPGKTGSLTVFPVPSEAAWRAGAGYRPVDALEAELRELVARLSLDLVIDPAGECVNLLVPGVDKGLGLDWLAQATGVSTGAIAGIGDSLGDLAWLPRCGLSAAPANAVEPLRNAVHLPLRGEDVDAVLELYRRVIEINRRSRAVRISS